MTQGLVRRRGEDEGGTEDEWIAKNGHHGRNGHRACDGTLSFISSTNIQEIKQTSQCFGNWVVSELVAKMLTSASGSG